MKNLTGADWRVLISAVGELHSDFDPRTLPERAMAAALKLAEADSVAFTGINFDGSLSGLVWDSSAAISSEDVEIFARFIHEQPLFGKYLVERSAETLKITDLMTAAEFERTNIYNEFYRRVGVRNQLVSPLAVSPDLLVTCSLNTSGRDFSERSKALAEMFAPHLVSAIRNAFAYERLSAALDAEACGIVAVASDGKAQFVSEYARRVLDKYFANEKRADDSLPEIVSAWLAQAFADLQKNDCAPPTDTLKISGADGELSVRLMTNKRTHEQALLIEEKRFPSPQMLESLNLTAREAEILFWIAQGKADDTIAAVCGISPRTVHKHVENIYAKLGVETRTSAMLKALEIL